MVPRMIPLLLATLLAGSSPDVPFAVRIISLEYPRLGALARITGTVVLRVRINSDGTVSRVNALSGHPVLVEAAEENIKRWKFSPPRPGQSPGGSEFDFTYIFKLEGVTDTPHPYCELVYEYPDKVTITSKVRSGGGDSPSHRR